MREDVDFANVTLKFNMYLKQNNNLAFFITHGQNNSIAHEGICETCFRPLKEDRQGKRDEGEGNIKEDEKSVKIIISDFCDETSAHGFSRCRNSSLILNERCGVLLQVEFL